MGWIKNVWLNFKTSLWFLPSIMVLGAILLALGMVELDHALDLEVYEQGPRFIGASSEGARKVLATIAASMITVAGVIFSITIVTLSLSANQYTPRILRNFTKDTGNQLVLGFFVSLFTYCLLVLRTIRGGEDGFIPAVSVLMAIVLAIIGIYLFIYFIHHSTVAIQASEILSSISAETLQAIDVLFPEELGEEVDQPAPPEMLAAEAGKQWHRVLSSSSGYIQAVDQDALLQFSQQYGVVLKMDKGVGEFVIRSSLLVSVLGSRKPDSAMERELNGAYLINQHRSIEQDPAFGIRQIVDIALKALSPSMNDSTTASSCVDHLAEIMHAVMRKREPSCYRYSDGKLRVIACGDNVESLLDLAFHEIRQNLRSNVALLLRILQRLEDLAESGLPPARVGTLWKHLQLFWTAADSVPVPAHDRDVIDRSLRRVAGKLGRAGEAMEPSPP
jgi:uncharacterized membrane protein